jgi:pimeloyl-ACP methyl ester carboxylesterase
MNITPSRLFFLHANGYPAGVYRVFLDLLSACRTVHVIDTIGTEARHRPGHGWRRMRAQVMDCIEALPDGPLVLVGHSMGGYLAAMAAARLPQRVSQVVLIDSPMVLGWRATLVSAAKATGLTWKLGPAPVAARRRNHWASREEARAHLGGKDFVQRWAPGVFDDFIRSGLHEHPGGGVTLVIPRETERDVYATIAHRDALLAVRRLRARGTPVGFIAGSHSEETRLAGREQNRRFWGRDWVELPTGHLVPMEAPEACAHAVLEMIERGGGAADGKVRPSHRR